MSKVERFSCAAAAAAAASATAAADAASCSNREVTRPVEKGSASWRAVPPRAPAPPKRRFGGPETYAALNRHSEDWSGLRKPKPGTAGRR